MKILKRLNAYRKNGNVRFVYALEGSAAEKKEYKKDQGEYYLEDADSNPIYNTSEVISDGTPVLQTTNGNWVIDNLTEKAEKNQYEVSKAEGKILAIASALGVSKKEAAIMMLQNS